MGGVVLTARLQRSAGTRKLTASVPSKEPAQQGTEIGAGIPKIEEWVEGLLDYFNLECPRDWAEHLRFGFSVGRQVIGLYIIEILLKYTREGRQRPYRQDHNLWKLFRGLPPKDKKKIEKKYKLILRSDTQVALDIEKSVSALLSYLGFNPITSTRYFWERSHGSTPTMSILVAPHMLRRVIYAILIPLYRYPQGGVIRARFTTSFVPRARWANQSTNEHADRRPEKKKPDKNWLTGLRHYYGQQSPRGEQDPRRVGFAVGSQIVGLYLAEMLLKYALDEREIAYAEDHNLEGLFQLLPVSEQESLRRCQARILHSQPGHAWDFERTIDDLLAYLQRDPFTGSRYFWDSKTGQRGGVLFAPRILIPLIDALFTELHGIVLAPTGTQFYERDFESFEGSLKQSGVE